MTQNLQLEMGKDCHLTHLFELDRFFFLKLLEERKSLFILLNPSSLSPFDEATNYILQISFFTPESFSLLCPWHSVQSAASPKPVLPADTPSLSDLPQEHMIDTSQTGANAPARNAHKKFEMDAFLTKPRPSRHPGNGNWAMI